MLNKLFDNVPQAFTTLFMVGSLDNWSQVMYAAVDSTGIGMQVSIGEHLILYVRTVVIL
jgi:hypothetical protein